MKAVLVTGASGFVGSALVQGLTERGIETSALVRSGSLHSAIRRKLDGAELLVVDSDSDRELHNAIGRREFEIIYHLASAGVRSKCPPAEIIAGNVNLMEKLLCSISARPPRRLIYTGSCSEYGLANDSITEEMLPNPTTLYGAAKLAAYHCGRALASDLGIPFVNLRLFGVYGEGEHSARLIPYVIRQLVRDQPAEMSGGEQVRDFIHVDDVVRALVTAASAERLLEYPTYNVCTGDGHSVRQVAGLVADLLAKPRSLLRWGRRPHRPTDLSVQVGCCDRFARTTGWAPSTGIREGIQRMVAAHYASDADSAFQRRKAG